MKKPIIGFIGQGFIGKNYANDFEKRGFQVVRYSLEEPYIHNKEKIAQCDMVFIAVPTPSTPRGFDFSIVEKALSYIGAGKIAVIKSTMLPGTTARLAQKHAKLVVLHSPEFLTEATAAEDAAHPNRNIVGLGKDTPAYRKAAQAVLASLPKAPYTLVCTATEAELIKYGGNCWFYSKIIFINVLYDLTQKVGARYDVVREGLSADPRVGKSHLMPMHMSGTLGSNNFALGQKAKKTGQRGAGGHCFIKDFAAFANLYQKTFPHDKEGVAVLRAMEQKNNALLMGTGKDIDLLMGVYGPRVVKRNARARKVR